VHATSKERQVVIHNDQWRGGKAPTPLARLTMSRGFEDGQGDIPMIHYAMQLLEAVHHPGKAGCSL
jgi:hypothetical protein